MTVLQLKTSRGTRSFHHRGTEADRTVIRQIFTRQEYALRRLRRGPELLALGQSLPRPFILDGGAHIGASACWFALKFPGCHVVAFEPDPGNFELLRRNTEGLDVELHHAALGAKDGKARLLDPGEGEWGYRTEPAADGAVPLVSVSRLVAEKREAGFSPFIAKIDIEGGEAGLFAPPTGWVDAFPLLTVELHDWMLPGQGTSRSFLQCVAERDRDFVHLGENIFSIRNARTISRPAS